MEVSVKLTPPRGPDAKMTPREYLLSPPTRAHIKRKLQFDNIDPMHLRLDPTPKTEDSTIGKYYERVSSELQNDRRKLQLMMPFGEQWERLNQRVNASAVQYCDVLPLLSILTS
jgi:hypothetical protein